MPSNFDRHAFKYKYNKTKKNTENIVVFVLS